MTLERLSNTILIASGKGGVGKTWLSINLAQALAAQNKRVLLIDGDLGLANINHQLGLKPQRNLDLESVLKKKCSFKDAIVTYQSPNDQSIYMDIITSHTLESAATTLSKANLSNLRNSLSTIAPQYDHMIIDLSAGLDQIIQEFSTFARHCFVLVTDELTSATDALAFIKVARHRNPALPLHVVVNMADSHQHGQQVYTDLATECTQFLNKMLPLAGIIHRDHRVADSIRDKTPTLLLHPTSQTARDIERMAVDLGDLTR